jgi:hypothetical protein
LLARLVPLKKSRVPQGVCVSQFKNYRIRDSNDCYQSLYFADWPNFLTDIFGYETNWILIFYRLFTCVYKLIILDIIFLCCYDNIEVMT